MKYDCREATSLSACCAARFSISRCELVISVLRASPVTPLPFSSASFMAVYCLRYVGMSESLIACEFLGAARSIICCAYAIFCPPVGMARCAGVMFSKPPCNSFASSKSKRRFFVAADASGLRKIERRTGICPTVAAAPVAARPVMSRRRSA